MPDWQGVNNFGGKQSSCSMPPTSTDMPMSSDTHDHGSSNTAKFSIHQEFLGVNSWTCEPSKLGLTPKEIERRLNHVEDQLGDVKSIGNVVDNYELLQALVGSFNHHPEPVRLKLLGAVISGFNKFLGRMERTMGGIVEGAQEKGQVLGIYGILVSALIVAAESNAGASLGGNSKKGAEFDWSHLKVPAAEAVRTCFSLDLARLVQAAADRESIVSNLVKATHRMLETPAGLKNGTLKQTIQGAWVLAVTRQGFGAGMRTIVLQDLSYYESLCEPLADFLAQLSQAEGGQSGVVGDVLEQVGSHRFSGNETGSVKISATFLTALARLAPREVLRSLTALCGQLDSESYMMRMSMVELFSTLLAHLGAGEKTEAVKSQIKSLLGVLEERLMDVNAFVRTKVLSLLSDQIKLGSIPITHRSHLLSLVTQRVADKSSNVRRKAIQILGDFVRTHPFCVEGGELSLCYFAGRLEEISRLIASSPVPGADDTNMDDDDDAKSGDGAYSPATQLSKPSLDPAQVSTLLLQKRYYSDAASFTRQLESVIPTLCQLLGSTVKAEVIDVIEFFVEAHAYRMDGAQSGLSRMIHLVWDRDASSGDPAVVVGKGVRESLFDAFRRVYLDPGDPQVQGKAKCDYIASSLADLVRGASLAEITSLGAVIEAVLGKRWIPDGVVYSLLSLTDGQDRRPAIILLALLAPGKRSILLPRIDTLIKAGFSGYNDPVSAQYTLVALRSLASAEEGSRIPNDSPIFTKISEMVINGCDGLAWLETISEAVKTVYALAAQPGSICEALIHSLAAELNNGDTNQSEVETAKLARLLHVVGQVAASESRHLDTIERHWKARQQGKNTSKMDELDQIGSMMERGEEDFSDLVTSVRDHQLLYGPSSLLAIFGPLLSCICANGATFQDTTLQRIAALSLSRFMAISSPYCQEHLALFLTLLERSPDPVIRSNLVIALGDLVQAFPTQIDSNIGSLFARLQDTDGGVRRNTLLVLTHLALTGLIKVKGQLGDVARCLLDEEPRISALARSLFHELASKDPALIANHLPDILSSLTAHGVSIDITESDFQSIMRFIMDFVVKKRERQMDTLVDKLCQRFRVCTTPRQSRDVAYCLSLCSYASEKALRRLVDAFPLYQDRLSDAGCLKHFADILAKARKTCRGGVASAAADDSTSNGMQPSNTSAGELKTMLDDWEARLLRTSGHESIDAANADHDDLFNPSKKTATKCKSKKKTARSRPFQLPSTDDDDDEDDQDEEMVMSGAESIGPDAGADVDMLSPDEDDVLSGDEVIPQPKQRPKLKFSRRI